MYDLKLEFCLRLPEEIKTYYANYLGGHVEYPKSKGAKQLYMMIGLNLSLRKHHFSVAHSRKSRL